MFEKTTLKTEALAAIRPLTAEEIMATAGGAIGNSGGCIVLPPVIKPTTGTGPTFPTYPIIK